MGASQLDHPLLGSNPRLTAVGLGYVLAVAGFVLASGWRRTLFRSDGQLPAAVDTLSWLVIALAVLSTFVVVFVYPLLNGGPLLTMLIALTPHLSVAAVTGSVAGGVDLTVALAAAGLGGTVAIYRESVGYREGWQPSLYPGFASSLTFTSICTVSGAATSYQVLRVAGPHTDPGGTIAVAFTVLAAGGLSVLWLGYGLAMRVVEKESVILEVPEATDTEARD